MELAELAGKEALQLEQLGGKILQKVGSAVYTDS